MYQYCSEEWYLLTAYHLTLVKQPLEEQQDWLANLVLLQVPGLLHSLPLAGQDVFDHFFEHVDLGVGLVVVADE